MRCPAIFAVARPTEEAPATAVPQPSRPPEQWRHEAADTPGIRGERASSEPESWEEGSGASESPSALGPAPFGSRDPDSRARRLARALVSDIVVYHPDRRDRSLRAGTLRQEFREEIRKSWDEYASQVGGQIARDTRYFQDALNEILAEGNRLF